MSAAPLLAELFHRLDPPPRLLDLGLPEARLFPWVAGAVCGVAGEEALPPAERALLAGFRDAARRRPPFGFDAAADAAMLAQAPAAWGGGGEWLVCLPGAPPLSLAPLWRGGAWALLRAAGQAGWVGSDRGRIMLLAGTPAAVEHYDLVVPVERLEEVLERLHEAAAALAAEGAGWRTGRRRISARLASLTLLREAPQRPGLALAAPALWHDAAVELAGGALPLTGLKRLRLLLGSLPAGPARLVVLLRGGVPPVLFLGGRRLAATPLPGPAGTTRLEAATRLAGGPAEVLGLAALPGPAPALLGLEVAW
ncbi:hypothetical protein [Siccirubricoccus phaeus]|uniref:hypothetical protein n=1 Tax=Siccirubricoccus phaeus TaxID=2595053 RepID=UPI00165B4EB1|nr:hypothetical protein [Siccirubricoccus phaeus]